MTVLLLQAPLPIQGLTLASDLHPLIPKGQFKSASTLLEKLEGTDFTT